MMQVRALFHRVSLVSRAAHEQLAQMLNLPIASQPTTHNTIHFPSHVKQRPSQHYPAAIAGSGRRRYQPRCPGRGGGGDRRGAAAVHPPPDAARGSGARRQFGPRGHFQVSPFARCLYSLLCPPASPFPSPAWVKPGPVDGITHSPIMLTPSFHHPCTSTAYPLTSSPPPPTLSAASATPSARSCAAERRRRRTAGATPGSPTRGRLFHCRWRGRVRVRRKGSRRSG